MKTGFIGALKEGVSEVALENLAPILMDLEAELDIQVRSTVATVDSVGEVTLKAGGKRLRPALSALSALATGCPFDPGRISKLGAALELVHMATLIHDDVIDESKTRRGVPTAASLHGNTAAILSGDVLLARAMRLLALDGDLEIIRAVSEAVVELAEGEVLELEARGKLDLDERDHFEVLQKKTSSLISCSSRVGGIVAGADPKVVNALTSYGHHLGLAFQIADDLLDFRGDRVKTGKPWATDFREGQSTLPLIYLLPTLTGPEQQFVGEKFGNGVKDLDLEVICNWMTERGAFKQAEIVAKREASEAQKSLGLLPETPYRELLYEIARFVVEREA